MANLIIHIPSCRWALVSLFVLLVLGGFAASATFTALAFIEIRQLDFARSQSMSRLRDLEAAPYPTPMSAPTPQPTATPHRIRIPPTATPQPTATPTRIRIPPTPTPQPTATPTRIRIPPTPTPVPTWNDVYKRWRRGVVVIETGNRGRGTGWAYEEGWLVTAAHVVEGYRAVRVRYEDASGVERDVTATVVGIDKHRDVAAIRLPEGVDLTVLTGRRWLFTRDGGMAVMVMGYSSTPPVGWPSIRVGVMTTTGSNPSLDNLIVVETDAAFDPGDSGGPVLDSDGNVIAIAQASNTHTSSAQRVQGRQMGVSIEEVERVWGQLKQGHRLNERLDYWFNRR